MAEYYTDRQVSIMFAEETQWGAAATVDRDIGLIQSASSSEKNNLIVVHALGVDEPVAHSEGKYECSGSIEWVFQHAEILEYVLGAVTDTAGTPHTHTLVDNPTVTSITIAYAEDGTADLVQTYEGCHITSFTLTLALDDVAKARMDWVGQTVTGSTSAVAYTQSTDTPFTFKGGSLESGTEGSEVVIAAVENAEFTFARKFEPAWGLGSRIAVGGVTGNWDGDFRATVKFLDSTEYDRFLGASNAPVDGAITEFGVDLELTNGLTGANARSMVVDLKYCKYDTFDTERRTDSYVTATIAGKYRDISILVSDNTTDWSA